MFLFSKYTLKFHSPLQISWYRRQKKLHETDRVLFQRKPGRLVMVVSGVGAQDFGNYSCKAENALGRARAYTALAGRFF